MSLKQKTTSGLLWSGTSQGVRQILQFVITAILARLLTPDDFPNAKFISDRTISLPLSAKLSDGDVGDVIEARRRALHIA